MSLKLMTCRFVGGVWDGLTKKITEAQLVAMKGTYRAMTTVGEKRKFLVHVYLWDGDRFVFDHFERP